MAIIKITAAKNSDNDTIFDLVDSDGVPVDLDALGVTLVRVSVCSWLRPTGEAIDSSTDAVAYSGGTLTVKFGKLQLDAQTQPYFPKIAYVTPTKPNGEVIAGEGYSTEIQLKAVC